MSNIRNSRNVTSERTGIAFHSDKEMSLDIIFELSEFSLK
jgi:hypothetical protein